MGINIVSRDDIIDAEQTNFVFACSVTKWRKDKVVGLTDSPFGAGAQPRKHIELIQRDLTSDPETLSCGFPLAPMENVVRTD